MTLLLPLLIFLVGLGLSAVFSGTEIGFYRVSRLRLQIAGGSGDRMAAILAWFAERPAFFISTTLVGNNLANYLVSFGTVILVQQLSHSSTTTVDLIAALVATPIVFIFGELIPKRLFLQAPYRLLRLTGPIFSVFAVLLLPVTALLWVYSRVLSIFIPAPVETARSQIASGELRRILEEGEHAGLIVNIQRRMARAILQEGAKPVHLWSQPVERFPAISANETWHSLRQAGFQEMEEYALVYREQDRQHLLGYVFLPHLMLNPHTPAKEFVRPILRVHKGERLVFVLRLLFQRREPLALVVDQQGQPAGILRERDFRRVYLGDSSARQT